MPRKDQVLDVTIHLCMDYPGHEKQTHIFIRTPGLLEVHIGDRSLVTPSLRSALLRRKDTGPP